MVIGNNMPMTFQARGNKKGPQIITEITITNVLCFAEMLLVRNGL